MVGGVCSQEELMRSCSECYLLLEQYKLRTNLVGVNMEKELIEPSYAYLEERITDRYSQLFEKLKETVARLQTAFRIAQANALRTLNNIFRNYRRRVGTLTNEPLSALKYARYDRQEKMLLESMIYGERENRGEVVGFKEELERSLTVAGRQLEEKYRRSDKIREDYNTVFEIIDKSECYTYKYYEGFERTMLATVASLEPLFDKLNAFLSVWENVGSTKAYEARSARELEHEEKAHEGGQRRLRPSSYEEETEEQLEELMKNCPQHSPQREEYRKRLNQLRRYNSQKQKKLDMVGKMYSKRRNRAGILVSRGKEVSVLEWLINLDNSKVPYSHHDEFKHYRADNDHSDYRPTPYENQRPLKTAEEAREQLEKHRPAGLNHEWWYDRFGRQGTLDLIAGESQQVQKRVEFEVVRQTELQNSDDRRKRELLEKQNYQMKENERRECLHVGYRHIHDKTELDWLIDRTYNTQYIPGVVPEDEDISFSDEEGSQHSEDPHPPLHSATQEPNPKGKHIAEEFPIIKMEERKADPPLPLPQAAKEQKGVFESKGEVQGEMALDQQIITTYFREYSKKMTRKQQQPGYKKTAFLYFKDTASIDWPLIGSHQSYEKIFVYTPRSILFFSRIFSARQEKVKCGVYTVQNEQEQEGEGQEAVRKSAQECFQGASLVTVRFTPIYLEGEDANSFMMGLLVVLVREGKMFEDSEIKDYVNEGRDIIEDFNEYYFPSENKSTKSLFMRKFMPQASHELFAPTKKAEAPQDTESQKSTVLTEPQSSISTMKIEKEMRKEQQVPVAKDLPAKEVKQTEKEVEVEVRLPAQTPTYASLHEQPQLKRSNSREQLGGFDLQLQMRKLQQEGGESGGSEDNDYVQF